MTVKRTRKLSINRPPVLVDLLLLLQLDRLLVGGRLDLVQVGVVLAREDLQAVGVSVKGVLGTKG